MKTTGNTKNICVDLTPKKTKDEIEEEKHQREQEKKNSHALSMIPAYFLARN